MAVTLGSDDTGGSVDYYLGLLATLLEDWDLADRHFNDALRVHTEWETPPYIAHTLYAWANLLVQRGKPGDPERAYQLLQKAGNIASELGMNQVLGMINVLTERLDTPSPAALAGLSQREVEVLALIVDGCTNQEIAARLFISPHTVANHVAHILTKLNVESRTAAATWAITNNLT